MSQLDAVIEKAKKRIEKLKGGLADGMSESDFDKDDLEEGKKVEREHTKDEDIAREISQDHLCEDPKYYKKLKLIEKAVGWGGRQTGIGRTGSGKIVHLEHNHPTHASFTPAEHRDAYLAHAGALSRMDSTTASPVQIAKHKKGLDHHFKMMNPSVSKAKRPEHKDWKKEDHHKAMLKHHKRVMRYAEKMHNLSKKKGALHHAAHKVLTKMLAHHAGEVHYHHKHSQES